MKRDLFIISLCFVAGMAGANVQPLLTGAGKILFPESATPATISASSGALTLAAGGSNQNVNLTPTGTGVTSATGNVAASGTLRTTGFVLPASGSGLELFYNAAIPAANVTAIDRTGVAYLPLRLNGLTTTVNAQSGGCFGVLGACTYDLDTTGDTNTSGVFRKAGTAGISATLTIPNGGSATISGGIITAKTDPTSTAISAQNVVTGSRALGTVYHNTGTSPIYVLATLTCQPIAGNAEAQALTDAATPPTTVVAATFENLGTSKQHLGFWVLPGNYYSITVVTNQVTLSVWTEWN